MEKYQDDKGTVLLITKNKVVLILNPYQFQGIRHSYLSKNSPKDHSDGSYKGLRDELVKKKLFPEKLIGKYNGSLLSLFLLIKDKNHEGD